MVTFLASGFWHGASWNYVWWGAYHGVLLVLSRVAGMLWSPPASWRKWLTPLQVAGMFVLTLVGWLLFRETDAGQLWRHLHVSPFQGTAVGYSAGLYLFLLTALYSAPLWCHDLWVEFGGVDLTRAIDAPETAVDWRRVLAQAAVCGVMMAAIVTLRSQTSLDFIYFAF